MLQVSVYSIIRLLDMLQDAGLLEHIPQDPHDNDDFVVGEDTYMIEACDCGSSTCLQWHAMSLDKATEKADSDPDLVITLAIRARSMGYVRLSDYLKEMHGISFSLAMHLSRTVSEEWVNVCKAFDPFAVGLAMSICFDNGLFGIDTKDLSTTRWGHQVQNPNMIH